MSTGTGVGSERNLLAETPEHAHQLEMTTPILFDRELQSLRHVDSSVFKARTVDITWPVEEGPDGMVTALERACAEADEALADGVNILILSDRGGQPRARGDPVAARGRRGAPPPRARGHAPADRARARVRRAARGPPLRDADRLRRERDQPVPDVRVARDARRRRPRARRRRTSRPRSGTSSRASPRACSRRSPRWGSRRSTPTTARRSSRPSGSTRRSWTRTSWARRRGSAASTRRCWRSRRCRATRAGSGSPTTTCCRSAASTRGAARASTTCGTRRRSRSCSTRSATAASRPTTSTPSSSTRTRRAGRRCAGC